MVDEVTPKQRDELKAILTPAQAGALTAYGEARNQSVSGLQAVLSVIRNRVALNNPRWGNTWSSVVLAHRQFSCWNDDDPNSAILYDLAQSLLLNQPLVNPVLDVCLLLADRMVAQVYPSNVMDATHYYAPAVVDKPTWAYAPAVRRTVIGAHVFYSGVRS